MSTQRARAVGIVIALGSSFFACSHPPFSVSGYPLGRPIVAIGMEIDTDLSTADSKSMVTKHDLYYGDCVMLAGARFTLHRDGRFDLDAND